MKKTILCCLPALLMVFVIFSLSYAAKPAKIEVLYMNHGPLLDTLDELKGILSGYGNKVSVSWFDFETSEGEKFMARKGLNQHIPLVIWINDSSVVKTDGKEITFVGFPTGSGPAFFQGKWSMADFKSALDQATQGK